MDGDKRDPGAADPVESAPEPPGGGEPAAPVDDSGGAPPGAAPAEAVTPEARAEAVGNELESTRAKLREVNERLLRTAADFDNFRKRALREKEQYVARAAEGLVRDLLPVLDNFDRALQAQGGATDVAALAAGVEMIRKQLSEVLARTGVEPFDSLGARFDPAVHEAIQQASSPDHAPGTVISEFARGYKMGGRLLRPALVVVADASSGSALGEGGGGGDGAAPPDGGAG